MDKHKHSTHTTLHNICHQIIKSFYNSRHPQRTVVVALDINKTFDVVNKRVKNLNKNFIASYIKERQACTQYNATLSKLKRINTGILQDCS